MDLMLSPEVEWYLEARGYKLDGLCPPAIKTPDPRNVKGAKFDALRVDKAIAALRCLRHTQGKWAGRPLDPDPWQVAYIIAPVFGWVAPTDDGDMVRIIRKLYVDVPRKNGKGIDATESILTAEGWKKFGDLVAGDLVHSIDGSLTKITYVSPTHNINCYKITFADGQSIVCDRDHLWHVHDRYAHDPVSWRQSQAKGAWRTVSTPELFENQRCGSRSDTRFSVSMDRSIDRVSAELGIDPYLLGIWLGDGSTSAARITTADAEIVDSFRAVGYRVNLVGSTTIEYSIKPEFLVALRNLGVLGNKHAPDAYLTASEDQRLDLLRGLMDSDGGVNVGPNTPRVEFTSTKLVLAEAVLFLARSLGWKATIRESRATLYGKDCGPKWRVAWTAYRDRSPFRLARKTALLHASPSTPSRSATNSIVSVEKVSSVPTKCIQVAHPSRQFLVGRGLIPTHNTTLAGGLALLLAFADHEPAAQVLAVAATKDQAGAAFEPARSIAEGSPEFKQAGIRALRGKIIGPDGSWFSAFGSVGDFLHGKNVSGAVVDELHIHKDGKLLEAVETGTVSRQQPLIVIITTADDGGQESVYSQQRKLFESAANGAVKLPSLYGCVWAADEDDRIDDPATWAKANPGLGVSVPLSYMKEASAKALENPVDFASFQRLHLGIRTKQTTKYIMIHQWDRNASIVEEEKLKGREAFGGLDLAAVNDLTAFTLLFPNKTRGGYDSLFRIWLPEGGVRGIDRRTNGMGTAWVRQGLIRTTPGDVVDYEFIKRQILSDMETFQITEIAFDRWNSSQIVNDLLNENVPLVAFGQGFASMNAPTKELARLCAEGTAENPLLRHGGNACVKWQIDNLAVDTDPAGNVKPNKKNSGDKIDSVVALIMALDRAMQAKPKKRSAYADDEDISLYA